MLVTKTQEHELSSISNDINDNVSQSNVTLVLFAI